MNVPIRLNPAANLLEYVREMATLSRSIGTTVILLTLIGTGARAEAGAATAAFLDDWCRNVFPGQSILAGYFSSYDRTGANDDGFKGTWSSLYRLDNGEHVIVDLDGPGRLYTLWFTGPGARYDPSWGFLRFYLDHEISPRVEIEGEELFNGEHALFPRPLVANEYVSTGGNVAHVPIAFHDRLIITTEKPVGFYNAFYHLYPSGTPVESWPGGGALSDAAEPFRTAGAEPKTSSRVRWYRGTVRLHNRADDLDSPSCVDLLNVRQEGYIAAVYLNPLKPLSAEVLNDLWLQCWWDDGDEPAVNVPIGPFFGSGQGEAAVRSLPIGMSPSAPYYCFFHMPFRDSARIAIESRVPDSKIDLYYNIAVEPPGVASPVEPARFCAVFNREFPTRSGVDYTILDLDNRSGLYLGHVLIVHPDEAGHARWWEGDLRIRRDGMRQPFLNGTGHEDELLGGWSTRWQQGPYSLALHGLPSVRPFPEKPGQKYNGAITGYRFFYGGIPFRQGLTVTTEHGTGNDVPTNYASVAFYYSAGEGRMKKTDAMDLADASSRSAHEYDSQGGQATVPHVSAFDGDEGIEGTAEQSGIGWQGQKTEVFTLRIVPENDGVLLRRLFHQSYGRHRARVLVDGEPVGVLNHPDDGRVDRWRQADFVLPAKKTRGKAILRIRIESLSGCYNAFTYETWAITRP